MGKTSNLKKYVAVVVLFVVGPWAYQSAYGQPWDGNGAPNDPYLIYDANDMQAIGADANYWDAHFKLMADIDMNEIEYNIIAGSSSKGYFQGEPFIGSFDGDGYVIKNLTINDSNQSYFGLFGCIGTGGEIKNLKLENFDLKGYSYVGAVAGENKGSIINCFSEVNVQVDYRYAGGMVGENDGNISLSSSFSNVYGYADLGGLVGWNNGTIDKCDSEGVTEVNVDSGPSCGGLVGYNKGNILNSRSNSTVYGGSSDVGGLAGTNRGIIEKCHSNGYVSGTEYSAGGLVGYNNRGEINNCYANVEVSGVYDIGGLVGWDKSGYISGSYAAGNVLAQEYVGGLIGWMTGSSITNCYSTGDVNGIEYIGGLSGGIDSAGTINDSYATGKVVGNENAGGLLGYNTFNTGIIVESFWDSDINPDLNDIGNVGDDPNITGLPTAQMQDPNTFIDAGWDFNTPIWKFCSLPDYPKLAWQACPGPEAPVLASKPNTTIGTTNTIFWEAVAEANDYHAQCANDANFTGVIYDSGWIADTNYTFTGLELGQRYWYRVKAKDASGIESDWSNIESSLQVALAEAVETVLDANSLKNANMKNALLNKLSAAQAMIDDGRYQAALNKLENDILAKTDGCAETGQPDKNDWITSCEEQTEVYPLIMETIEYVRNLME